MRLQPVGEDALLLQLGDSANAATSTRVQAAVLAIESVLGEDLVDLVPSYASVLILYDPLRTDHLRVARPGRGALRYLPDPHAQAATRCGVLAVY